MKQPLTLTEQVQRIKENGFIVDNDDELKNILSNVNYYRLRGYWLTFETEDVVTEGTNFQEVLDVYIFDMKLRHWLLSVIEPIEVKLRTQFAYVLAHSHGSSALNNADLFTNPHAYSKCMKSLEREVERAKKNKVPFVMHNLETYGDLPIWASVELMSFGTLSRFYGILQPDLQAKIAHEFGVNKKYLVSWFHHLSTVRNICAHHGRFYNRVMAIKPKLLKRHKHFDSLKEFPTFLILKELTEESKWVSAVVELRVIVRPNVSLRPMAFPADWYELLIKEE